MPALKREGSTASAAATGGPPERSWRRSSSTTVSRLQTILRVGLACHQQALCQPIQGRTHPWGQEQRPCGEFTRVAPKGGVFFIVTSRPWLS